MRETMKRGLMTGMSMAAAETAALVVSSTLRRGSPWGGVNAMATAIGVGGRRVDGCYHSVATPVGLALHVGHLIAWGMAYEGILGAAGRRSSAVTGVLSGGAGMLFDQLVLPERTRKNMRQNAGVLGTLSKYLALGIASALAGRGRESSRRLEQRVVVERRRRTDWEEPVAVRVETAPI